MSFDRSSTEDLAAELLAEEGDVAADDRAEIEQRRLRMRAQAGEELRQRLGRMRRRVRGAAVCLRIVLAPA